MQGSDQVTPRSPSWTERGRSQAIRRAGVASDLRRWLLLIAALVAVVAALARVTTTDPAENGSPPPTARPTAGVSTAAPAVAAVPTVSRPQPTPTPASLRPFALPTMPPASRPSAAPVRRAGSSDPDPSTDHVVVMDGGSGAVLFERNARQRVAPASLTKIMTALLGIERSKLPEPVKIDVNARDLPDSTVMGLEPGLDLTLEDLLYGLMLPSGNDAAIAIGRHVAGTDEIFLGLMNQRAEELGLANTHFANPHGLDARDHHSSPGDMAALARYAMQYEEFRKLAAARSYDIRRSNISYTVWNLNPLLGAYPGADGVKVGFTDDAGRSFVASATRNGHRVYVAFMRSKAGLLPDARLLLDWAFNSFDWPER